MEGQSMKLADKIMNKINKKHNKVRRLYTIDFTTLKLFEKKCKKLQLKYSNVVEKLMLEFLNR